MKVYLYNETTKVFQMEYEAQESPNEKGSYITPTNSTSIEPPKGGIYKFINGNWVKEEVLQESITTAPSPPNSITQRQMRLTLLSIGIYDQVEAAIDAMPGIEGKAAKITWTWAQDIKRDNPLLLSLASSFGLSEEDIDNLFIAASSIE